MKLIIVLALAAFPFVGVALLMLSRRGGFAAAAYARARKDTDRASEESAKRLRRLERDDKELETEEAALSELL